MGFKHEAKHFKLFKEKFKKTIIINKDLDEKSRFNKTKKAIQDGYDLIYHAFLIDGDFRGEADFLIKTKELKSKVFGDYSYEVYDTKISRNLRPRHVTQITAYSYMLSKIQKILPKKMYLIDGSDITHEYKVIEYINLFHHELQEFRNFLSNIKKKNIYPEKCNFCSLCDWSDECDKIWEDDNYINLIAGSNKSQIEKLKKQKIRNVEQLINTKLTSTDLKINSEIFEKLKSQAKLQEEKRKTGESKIIILDPDVGKGFYKLPKPNEGDVFFDIEGFPRMDRPFEYLHGVYYKEKNQFKFKSFWAKDFNEKSERENFIELINFLEKHLKKYPEAHIYHYNTYEKRAIREMSSAYSKDFPKADIINDDWLRGEKYVDLFRIATQSIRTSEKDMSLKSLEQFYKFERKADIVKADDSVVKYDNWIATKNDKYKQDIINYNKEDCISTYELREFLIQKKPKNIDWFFKNNEIKKENNYVNKYSSKNSKKISREETEIDLNKRLEKKKNKKNNIFVENLQNLVGFHWRDNKPDHWEVFDRQEKSHLELEDDTECIANCVLQNIKPKEIDVGYIYSYKFNDQNYKLKKVLVEDKTYTVGVKGLANKNEAQKTRQKLASHGFKNSFIR